MSYSSNISTNILRDDVKQIDYVVTPNSKEVFDRIFTQKQGGSRSFNLIGNYGTGKSTFLWALEKNLKKEQFYFSTFIDELSPVKEYIFLKVVGDSKSLANSLAKLLKVKGDFTSSDIMDALDKKRNQASKKNHGLVLLVDEFGKFLEYASNNATLDELYLLQQISEWANDDAHETYFITTLHQNFSNYGKNLSKKDKLEWEKVKGRFVDLLFNEPVEQLIFFASKKLEEFTLENHLKNRFSDLLTLVNNSKLVSHTSIVDAALNESLHPLDWLSANVLVNALQRYGQNERSLFSFLNDDTKYSIKHNTFDFFAVSNVYDYLINTLPSEINGADNPHRAQWVTTFRALERAELLFEDEYNLASEVIKTICLVSIFSKQGGLFDASFIEVYFKLTRDTDVSAIVNKLESSGIIRFYKHSNKLNFFEGTDIDLEQELILVSKDINPAIRLADEVLDLVKLPVISVKRYSFETGTRRFFEYRIFSSFKEIEPAEGALDGYINLVFDEVKLSELKKKSKPFNDQIFVHYKNSKEIKESLQMVLKFDILLKKHAVDINAIKLLSVEREFYLQQLRNYVITNLFNSDANQWIYKGKLLEVDSKHSLYETLTNICYSIYPETPIYTNELINKHILSAPVNTARKYLFRRILSNVTEENLGFDSTKFPPEKAIYISLLQQTGIHKLNKGLGYFELSTPPASSNLFKLWDVSEKFLQSAFSNKRNLQEFYDMLCIVPYKLKRGFIDYWIPMFLMARKEDYALFHSNGNYIPFIDEDTLDLIHRKPADYIIKGYDVNGIKLNILESYKELVQIKDDEIVGTQSTFLSIYGNFLRFLRGLNAYTRKTTKLSNTAIQLRDAILNSKDPEDALFHKFPNALGYHTLSIKEDFEVLKSFTNHIQGAIREIRTAYDGLLERVEQSIISSFDCSSQDFDLYKSEIQLKLESIDKAVLSKKQQVYFMRLVSPLDDRISWIKSVADVALGKPIEELLDEEESLLINNISELTLGLIKASEIKKFNQNSQKGRLYSIRFFGDTGESKDEIRFVKSDVSKAFDTAKSSVYKTLENLNEEERKDLLIELLSKEIQSV